ncbi:MAG: hypothetical protein ACPGVU_13320, partial [Limisphaerales bacterium]
MKWLLFVVVLVAMATLYNYRAFQHFSHPEAMDQAQIARNLSEGKGFTTEFIRPANLYYLNKKTEDVHLDKAHPDLSNAPLYPWLLSWWMRAGFAFEIDGSQEFTAYQPEERIGWFNQFWLILTVLGLWLLAKQMFDEFVAWISAALLAGTGLLWGYSISGLSTCLLLFLAVVLAHVLTAMERRSEDESGMLKLVAFAVMAGVLTGAMGLTRYSMLWLIIPVVAYCNICFQTRGLVLGLVALMACLLTIAPWMSRNYTLSGMPFGTAGLVVHEEGVRFPGDTVQRLMNPEKPDSSQDVRQVGLGEYWSKVDDNLPRIIQQDLPQLGGTWIAAFFLVGLLVPFRSASLTRFRWFVVGCVFLFVLVQSLVRTAWGADVRVNSDDLLVVILPWVCLLGAGIYSVLVSQMEGKQIFVNRVLTPLFVILLSAPLILKLINGEPRRFAYPPYYPPIIQERGNWLATDELAISDVPWAMAWYGDRKCAWIPADFGEGFIKIYRHQPVSAVYLTSLSLDGRLISDQLKGRDPAFGRFVAEAVVNEEVPDGFPLKHAFAEGFPFQL